ncbi:MAG TPA: UdgX family uracil-DNA binding protein [Steroidobacteraceae bacterium]|nr:UdgX family uracil-DNA binding protein [Steroidobacteraceae bacterium]
MTVPRDFDDWRATARQLLAGEVSPDAAGWSDATHPSLFAASEVPGIVTDGVRGAPVQVAPVPKEFLRLLRAVALHRDPGRWDLMYRLLWRLQREGRDFLADAADPALAQARRFAHDVHRDLHKMHAFVRFRELPPLEEGGRPRFVAWYEPQHLILREGAPFFVRRFANMDWTIVTPEGAAVWDQRELRFEESPSRDSLPRSDAHEGLWRTYYRSICNVARLKPAAMKREMPKHRWKNLPEAVEIPTLMREAPRTVARFDEPAARARHAPIHSDGPARREEGAGVPDQLQLDACRRCPLWEHATQAVAGEGPPDARLVLVGEQPGDEEDLKGRPFVGPAGRLLDQLLEEAGIDRKSVYVTNAVKHFKWEPRGKRRIHKTPAQQEVAACETWLRGELARLRPMVVVALGATALRALCADAGPVGTSRGEMLTTDEGLQLVATWHPSALLRARDDSVARMRAEVVQDLRRAASLAAGADVRT